MCKLQRTHQPFFLLGSSSKFLESQRQKRRIRLSLTAILLFVTLPFFVSDASGQEWAEKMFKERTHDFGAVPRGAVVEHRFKVENIYLEDMHIVDIRSSCGCTAARVEKPNLKTYDQAEIVASLDTRNFLGRKDATLTVVFGPPFQAEVQLHVHSFIRGDVVLQPGIVDVGSVSEGTAVQEKISIDYAGRSNWQITAVESANPNVEAEVREVSRQYGQVSYELSVTVKDDAPVGYLKDHIILITDDPQRDQSQVIVPVTGHVSRAIHVSPSILNLGTVQPDGKVTKQLILQSKKPFRVLGFDCNLPEFEFKLPSGQKKLHMIPVTFVGQKKAGTVASEVLIKTDLGSGAIVRANVRAQVAKNDESSETEWHTPDASRSRADPEVSGPRHF